jgi:hypothetical protein
MQICDTGGSGLTLQNFKNMYQFVKKRVSWPAPRATNTGALMAQAAASSVNKEMEISMERLSTGKRINGAADDAAGVAIASRLDI